MRPVKNTPAHHTGLLAELVCSNSLRSADIHNAVGLLKEEMRRIADRKLEEKLLNFIKITAKLEEKDIAVDKFKKLFETK